MVKRAAEQATAPGSAGTRFGPRGGVDQLGDQRPENHAKRDV